MKCTAILCLIFSSLAIAAPAPQGNNRGPGGRFQLEGAGCTEVQGRSVCDDGLGNTFFADDPFSS
ncbi:hypothetical protein BHE90_007930 [Fusarium euwallaceae]|uniref:Uncharacterized protein n=3 Tax=Fusarium solani species complex TaxID=232080 RepID=A0A3M2S7E5_9HYPO|nr:hypothetical protein CDV36_006834 [Fusarium kuroshium]RSL68776.1 hypothetical protein CEP53_002481 [Fusarium sp. AF-6]RSL74983.1 hypothetical protein CEP51_011287 [Fusarium floridanum]RTE77559.1 hypothetical protein BHE90_007930 [Fusarium euwallaceae]